MAQHVLPDGRILCVYRRTDRPGLWAQLVRLEGTEWINEESLPLWGHNIRPKGPEQNLSDTFRTLRFGAPFICALQDSIYIVFWCYENCISIIRWIRFRLL